MKTIVPDTGVLIDGRITAASWVKPTVSPATLGSTPLPSKVNN